MNDDDNNTNDYNKPDNVEANEANEAETQDLGLEDIEKLTMKDIRAKVGNLSAQNVIFVQEFLTNNFDMPRAAAKAGFDTFEARHIFEANPDVRTICLWYMNKNAMPVEEALARLAILARADLGPYLIKREIKNTFTDKKGNTSEESSEIYDVDLEAMRKDGVTFMIKSLKYDRQGRLDIQLHDSMRALQTIAKVHGILNEAGKLTIDYNSLNDTQLRRIASGEDPRIVIQTPYQGVRPSTGGGGLN